MQILPLGEKLHNSGVALGLFDSLHIGHRAVIEQAAAPRLSTVVFSFERGTLRKNDDRELTTDTERIRLLEEMGVQTLVQADFFEVRELTARQFFDEVIVGTLDAKRVACGYNYRFGKGAQGDGAMLGSLCAERGIEFVCVSQVTLDGSAVSSSAVRNALDSGDAETAHAMLGRPFSYELPVLTGQRLGRTLGTPTINQHFPDRFLCPKYGVYASFVTLDGRQMPAVTNIGVRPTVGSDRPLSETWIPGYEGSLYGERVKVSLLSYLREEKKFPTLDELREAIFADGERAKEIFMNIVS